MLARKTILGAAVVCIVGLLLAGQSLSQPPQRGQRGQRGGAQAQGPQGRMQGGQRQGFQGRQFDPERMREMMEQRLKEQLGATDQAWKVLGPRVLKVQELSRQTGGGRGMMFGRGGFGGRGGFAGQGGGPGGPGAPGGNRPGGRQGPAERELTEVEKAMEQLRTLLEDPSATPAKIKSALTNLRSAREKVRQQLAEARQKLLEVVTVPQEGQLVLMGLLE